MSKHAPGPWKHKAVHGEPNQSMILADDRSGNWIMAVQHQGEFMPEKQEANARLIAAAPELLEALTSIKAEFERLKQAVMDDEEMPFIAKMRDAAYLDGVLAVVITRADAAIAKAEGA
jgi:hypothetical protein